MDLTWEIVVNLKDWTITGGQIISSFIDNTEMVGGVEVYGAFVATCLRE